MADKTGKEEKDGAEGPEKRGRGRPKKKVEVMEEATSMKKFLESASEEAIFAKASKIAHSPQKISGKTGMEKAGKTDEDTEDATSTGEEGSENSNERESGMHAEEDSKVGRKQADDQRDGTYNEEDDGGGVSEGDNEDGCSSAKSKTTKRYDRRGEVGAEGGEEIRNILEKWENIIERVIKEKDEMGREVRRLSEQMDEIRLENEKLKGEIVELRSEIKASSSRLDQTNIQCELSRVESGGISIQNRQGIGRTDIGIRENIEGAESEQEGGGGERGQRRKGGRY